MKLTLLLEDILLEARIDELKTRGEIVGDATPGVSAQALSRLLLLTS